MKKINKINFIITICFFIFFIPVNSISAQTKTAEKVKATLLQLFEYCANDDYYNCAFYFVYRGDDTTRKWVDVYDYTNEKDKNDVVEMCKQVKNIVESGGEFLFKKFTTEKESEGTWCVWQVTFEKGSKKTAYFACLKRKGKYALGDID